ncbi:MAG: lytic transglycosylase domain-containing protein [Candidatus Eremiobacteraeota bacterium]|nr:lytic transglycosylase domain-containing protein [Candidatus Eremiobacteraeota bacterium]
MPFVLQALTATLVFVSCVSLAAPALAESHERAGSNSAYAAEIRTINPRIQAWQSRDYASALLRDARAMHVDPRLVMAVVTVESHWDAGAVSIHGAQGLGQLKPTTARELGVEPFSGRENLRGVTLYLRQLLALFKSSRYALREAIAGYNAGPYAVKNYGGIPPRRETQHYVVKVLAAWRSFEGRLSAGSSVPDAPTDPTQRVQYEQTAYWGVH